MIKKLSFIFLLLCLAESSHAAITRDSRGWSYLARGGWTPTADSYYDANQVPSKAIDNNTATQWGTTNTAYPHYWQADMATAQNITFLHYLPAAQSWCRCNSADVYASDDGSTWGSSLWNGNLSNITDSYLYLLQGFDVTKRYFKILGNSGPSNQMCTRELWAGTGIAWIGTAENWRWGAGNDGAWLAINDNESDYWESYTTATAWIAFDFQQNLTLSAVDILADGTGNLGPTNVAIYQSSDGIDWGSAIVDVATDSTLNQQYVSLGTVITTRYLKLNFTKVVTTLRIIEIYPATDGSLVGLKVRGQVY